MNPQPLPHQIEAIDEHVRILNRYKATVEASSTGFGKMYVGCFVAKRLGVPIFVIAPKITHPDWVDVAARIGVEVVGVVNYEGTASKDFQYGTWRQTPKLGPDRKPIILSSGKKSMKRTGFVFKGVPPKALMIFDEVHACKGTNTANSRLLRATMQIPNKVMLMSATLAASPLDLKAVGEVLGLHCGNDFFWWCRRFGVRRGPFGEVFDKKPIHMANLHGELFPEHGHRKRTEDIPGFPDQQIIFQPIVVDKNKALADTNVKRFLDRIQEKREAKMTIPLTDLLWLREELELIKLAGMLEQIENMIEEDRSVVVFLNFRSSIQSLKDSLSHVGIESRILDGNTKDMQRKIDIADFQNNLFHVYILNQQAGGVGINLHDLNGRPRVALISPSYRADHLIQSMGRIRRANGLSSAMQRICYVVGSVEERVRASVQAKIANLETLNDGDFEIWDGETQAIAGALMNYDLDRSEEHREEVLGFGELT